MVSWPLILSIEAFEGVIEKLNCEASMIESEYPVSEAKTSLIKSIFFDESRKKT